MAVHWGAGIAVTGDRKAVLRVWDLTKGTLLWGTKAHEYYPAQIQGEVSAVAISPDGHEIYSSGYQPDHGALVKVWDRLTGKHIKTVGWDKSTAPGGTYQRIVPLQDGGHVLLGGDYDLAVWDLRRNMRLWQLDPSDSAEPKLIAATPDGRHLLTLRTDHLALWDGQGRFCRVLYALPREVPGMAQDEAPDLIHWPTVAAFVDPAGRRALTGGENGNLVMWDIERAKPRAHWRTAGEDHQIVSIAVSLDGRYALTGSFNQILELWDLHTGRVVRQLKSPGAE